MNNKQDKTNFGFQEVEKEQKRTLVGEVFSGVADKYDLMNDLMSAGIHRLWKKQFCDLIPNLNSTILDVAGGSGDIALRLAKRANLQNKQAKITVCDINPDMLETARNKAINQNLLHDIEYVCADGEKLPFADNSFDYYTISFGIRNTTDMNKVLKEAFRVLKPLGKFLCLEFSKVEPKILQKFYDFYIFNIVPKIGEIVAKDRPAYQYLAESIHLFPDQEHFKVMIQDAGFSKVAYRNLTMGIAAIHSGYKL